MAMTLINLMELYDTIVICKDQQENAVTSWDRLKDIVLDQRLDKDMLIEYIVSEAGSMETPWSQYNMYFWKHQLWFKVHQLEIEKMCDTVFTDYQWDENYRMHDKENRRLGRNEARRSGRSWDEERRGNTTNGGTDTESSTRGIGNEEETLVSAFNENLYQPREKTVSKPTAGSDTSQTTYGKTVNETEDGGGASKEAELKGMDEAEGTDRYAHGNTGVFAPQDLLKKERELAQFNVYQWILKMYKKDMVYLVY